MKLVSVVLQKNSFPPFYIMKVHDVDVVITKNWGGGWHKSEAMLISASPSSDMVTSVHFKWVQSGLTHVG